MYGRFGLYPFWTYPVETPKTLGVIGVDSLLRCYVTPPLGIEAFHRVVLLDRWNTIPGLMLGPRHLARNDVTATRASTPLRTAYKATSATQRR